MNGVDEEGSHQEEEGQGEQWVGWIEVCALDEVPTSAKTRSTTDETGGWTFQSYPKYRKNDADLRLSTGTTKNVVQKKAPFLGTESKSLENGAVIGPKYFSAETVPEENVAAKVQWEPCPKEREINVVTKEQNGNISWKVLVMER